MRKVNLLLIPTRCVGHAAGAGTEDARALDHAAGQGAAIGTVGDLTVVAAAVRAPIVRARVESLALAASHRIDRRTAVPNQGMLIRFCWRNAERTILEEQCSYRCFIPFVNRD